MWHKFFSNISLLLITMIVCSGCYPNLLYYPPTEMEIVTLDPTTDLTTIKYIHVSKRKKDNVGVNLLITNKLKEINFRVSTELNIPDNVDAVVTYEDRWRTIYGLGDFMYMIRIIIREPKTGFPVASGKYYYSATYINKSPKEMIDKAINNIFNQVNYK